MAKISEIEITKLLFDEGAAPSTPASTNVALYALSDGLLRSKDDAGAVTNLGAGAELDYVAYTGDVSITATTEATANTVVTANAITFDGSTIVMIEFFAPAARPDLGSNNILFIYLYDGTSVGRIATIAQPTFTPSSAVGVLVPVHVMHRLTPTAAAHTYSIRARVNTGTGSVNAGAGGVTAVMPGFIRITRV